MQAEDVKKGDRARYKKRGEGYVDTRAKKIKDKGAPDT